ncbi:hypothetical protein [Herbidospora mongoliensis]|uniref:hypothetical protein n=1 Tax=Herbidospora mongoliensis TaxID=688067 RepID=UPI0008324ED8|nr:hypothetical protein [Herbidospora mongoliensis]
MPLTRIERNGRFYLTGVVDGSAEVYLGTRSLPVGNHWVGFDDDFSNPLVMRAFYDPTHLSLPSGYETVGYQQFVQFTYDGVPIPPSVFSPRMTARELYTTEDQTFVDFMDPGDAEFQRLEVPFYAYNAILLEGPFQDWYLHPHTNGSLYRVGGGTGLSRCPSIVAEVSADLLEAADVTALVARHEALVEIPIRPDDTREPYRIAIDHLTARNVDSDDEDDAPLLEDVPTSAMSAKVVGDYVLLTLPGEEQFGPTLVITTDLRPRRVVVYLIAECDMAATTANVASAALWRIFEYLKDEDALTGTQLFQAMTTHQRRRGRGGLNAPPFPLKPTDYKIEMRYTTIVAAAKTRMRRGGERFVSGFTWSVLLSYDEDTGLMECSTIRRPKELTRFAPAPTSRAYFDGRTSPLRSRYAIDIGDFTRAAMLRDDFAAGTKLTFL